MQRRSLLVVLLALASVAGVTGRAHAQAYDRAYAKSLIFSSGTGTTNTYTIPAPTLSSALSFTFPATTTAFGTLFNNGTGTLSWPATVVDPTDLAPGGNLTYLVQTAAAWCNGARSIPIRR